MGVIGVGELLDELGTGVDWNDAATWPASWQGRTIDPAVLAALDGVGGFDRVGEDDVRERIARLWGNGK